MKYMGMSLVFLLAACSPGPEPDGRIGYSAPPLQAATPIANIEWRLIELNGQPAVAGTPVTMRLSSVDQRVQGNGGCNQYSGPYTVEGKTLRFGEIIHTQRACLQDRLNQQEMEFYEALSHVDRYNMSGNTLRLYRGGREVARFTRS